MKKLFPDDLIDTRDIIERIEELESDNTDDDGEEFDITLWSDDDRKEYRGLQEIVSEVGEDACRDGVSLVHERYMTDYIKDYHLDCGGEYYEFNPKTYRHDRIPLDDLYRRAPFNHIDWEAVARDEATSYSIIEIDGNTYYHETR